MTEDTRPAPLGGNFWKLWSGSVVANLGDGLSTVAIPWLATAVTRDPMQIALVTFASKLPWLLFSLPAGVITDRLDRRKLVAAMDALRFVVMFAFSWVVLSWQSRLATADEVAGGAAELPDDGVVLLVLLYVMAFLLGIAEVLRDNTAQTLLPSVVPKDRLEKANGRLWGAEIVVNMFVGPPLAGLMLGLAFALPFFVNAGTFAVAAGLVFALAGQFAPKGKVTSGRIVWRTEIGEGVHWLWRHSLLRSLAFLLAGTNLLSTAASVVYVLFAQEALGLGATGFGVLMSGVAIGAVIGSLLADRVAGALGHGPSLLLGLAGLAVGLAAIGLTSSPVVVWVVFLTQGFLVILWNVITVSLRQTIIPDRLLGRVNSVYRFFGWGAISLGTLLGGAMVAVGETFVDREWALRLPYLVAAVLHLVLFGYALRRLTTQNIDDARRQASDPDA